MLEPPSLELTQRLRDWHLCQSSDLLRARRIVQRMARDLPAFDSVWIDALVQLRCLTPYQARLLESNSTFPLRQGDVVLLDQKGHRAQGGTWLVRIERDRQRGVLKRVRTADKESAAIVERARQLMTNAADFTHPLIVPPHRFWEDELGCAFLSRHVDGLPLRELLVRRGRFPAEIVLELARQLSQGLEAWHQRGQVHGDVRAAHILMTHKGEAILVEAGLRTIIEPEWSLHTPVSLEAYDGIAPELLGVGQQATPGSDWYALGCLLWQLLAGRPPFPAADRLAKLAAHQTRRIEDIREWAPETPKPLAAAITALTSPDSQQRPRDGADVRDLLQVGHSRSALLRDFRKRFDVAVPHLRTQVATSKLERAARLAMAATLLVAAVVASHPQWRADLAGGIAARWQRAAETRLPEVTIPVDAASGLLPLPPPTPEGTILLDQAGPYAAATIQHPGPLQILGRPGVCPEILIRDQPLRIASATLRLQNVTLRRDLLWPHGDPPRALILAQTQRIEVEQCTWDSGPADRNHPGTAGLAWRLVEPTDQSAGHLQFVDCVARGDGPVVYANQSLRVLAATNLLVLGKAPLVHWRPAAEQSPPEITIRQVTLRGSSAAFRCDLTHETPWSRLAAITATDCVLAIAPDGHLIELIAPQPQEVTADVLTWQGEASLVLSTSSLLGCRTDQNATSQALPADQLPIEGLLAGSLTFAGPPTAYVGDSRLLEADIPRRDGNPPGMIPERMGVCSGGQSPEDATLDPPSRAP